MRGREHVRAAARRALEALLARQLVESAANRDQAAAVVAREVALGGKSIAGRIDALIQRRFQVKVDLMMKRNWAGPEQERCSRQV